MSEGIFGKNADLAQRLKDRIAFHANEHRHTYEIGKGVMDALVLDLLADFRDAGGVILPVKPNGTVWLIRRRRVVSATVMFVGAGADGLVVRAVHRTRHREDGLPDEGSGRSGPGRRRSMATVKDLAAYVCDKLAGKVLIHRYDAYSTNSVYLKFDYGLGNSLRLSDQTGKAGLNYRFNIITTMKSLRIDTSGEYPRFYYPPDMVDQAIADIVKGVTEKRGRYHDYGKALETARARTKGERGFWEQARLVKGGEDHDVP